MATTAKSGSPTRIATRKAKTAQQERYAPKPKPAPQPAKPVVKHKVPDEALRKIARRVLEELKIPGKIPSEVVLGALFEVRDLVEAAVK